jgi:hypothetical protein
VRKENLLEVPEVLLSGEVAVGDEEVLDGEGFAGNRCGDGEEVVEANEVGGREMGREAEERQDITAVATVLDYHIRLPCTAHNCTCFSKYNFNILGK